nr:hypothetical protein [Marinitoga lauensis]
MSKSYGNIIMIDETSESLKKKVMPMMTDPARMRRTDPGNPEKCPVWIIIKHLRIIKMN